MSDQEKIVEVIDAVTITFVWDDRGEYTGQMYEDEARENTFKILAALEAEGYVVVPEVPTKEMVEAGRALLYAQEVEGWTSLGDLTFDAMIAARPRSGITRKQEPYVSAPESEVNMSAPVTVNIRAKGSLPSSGRIAITEVDGTVTTYELVTYGITAPDRPKDAS